VGYLFFDSSPDFLFHQLEESSTVKDYLTVKKYGKKGFKKFILL